MLVFLIGSDLLGPGDSGQQGLEATSKLSVSMNIHIVAIFGVMRRGATVRVGHGCGGSCPVAMLCGALRRTALDETVEAEVEAGRV